MFRSRLRDDAAPGYHETADALRALAEQQPGFVDYQFFVAEDGERVSIATFADHESHQAWATNVEHRLAQERGRREGYAEYSVQVGDCVRVIEHTFD